MKQSTWILYAFLLGLASCSKEMSKDLPLTKLREEAVFITTESGDFISYDIETGRKRWALVTTGASNGIPVFHNKMIYVVTTQRYMYTIDPLRGKITRETQIAAKNDENSLCAYGSSIFFASDSLYCYDTLHNKLWTFKEAGKNAFRTSPQYANDHVYFSADDVMYCVSSNGSLIWKFTAGGLIQSSPRITNGVVYFGCDDHKVYALQESNGNLKWSYLTGNNVNSSPAVYGGMCLVGSDDYHVYCIDTTTGLERWKFKTNERVISSPGIHEFTTSVIVGSNDYNLYAIDHVTGELKWKYPAGSIVTSSPMVYGNYIFFTSYDRYLYAVDARDGRILWKEFLNTNSLSAPFVDDTKKGLHPGKSGMSTY